MSLLDQLLYGIRQVETGGVSGDRYKVVNDAGAVGAYQVLKSNVPEWSRQALGRSMTWQQFRDSPSAQDAIARYKLGRLLKKFGSWQSAAAVWFSGQPDPNSRASDGGNTVRQYVDKVGVEMGKGSVSTAPAVSAMPSLGRSVYTAQQAGYQAETRVGPYGAPTNPFKLPGWIASQGGGGSATVDDEGVVEAGLLGDGGGLLGIPWDGLSTVVLSSLFVLGGLALVAVGMVYAVSPAAERAASLTPAGRLATAAKAV